MRDYQYELRQNGLLLMRGDAGSIGIIFGNLDGRNFGSSGITGQTHSQWLAYMESELKTPLELGNRIEMLSPEGESLAESAVGKSIEDEVESEVPHG